MNKPSTKDTPDSAAAELELEAMRQVSQASVASQRELAARLGISVGKTNFLLRALLDRGFVKVENFRRSDNKLGYLYLLTPRGMAEKAQLTREFLFRKEQEYVRLQSQIAALRDELAGGE